MKKLMLYIIAIAPLFCMTTVAQAESPQFTVCEGKYALCAASTCTPTGGTIPVNGVDFPAASCLCPLLKGEFLADLNGGNMQGSCDNSDKHHVWSLFTWRAHIPQEMNNWSKKKDESKTDITFCPASLNAGQKSVNCFSFNCTETKNINGVELADCTCPIGESFTGGSVPDATAFFIQAGQGNAAFCELYSIALPLTAQ